MRKRPIYVDGLRTAPDGTPVVHTHHDLVIIEPMSVSGPGDVSTRPVVVRITRAELESLVKRVGRGG